MPTDLKLGSFWQQTYDAEVIKLNIEFPWASAASIDVGRVTYIGIVCPEYLFRSLAAQCVLEKMRLQTGGLNSLAVEVVLLVDTVVERRLIIGES